MKLSPRQYEVVTLVVRGCSNKAIAKELELSVKTVEEYLQRISGRIGGEGKPRLRIVRWHYERKDKAA